MLGFLVQLNIQSYIYIANEATERLTIEAPRNSHSFFIIIIKGEPFPGLRNLTVVDLREGICVVRIIQLNEQHLKSMSSLMRLTEKAETRQQLPLTQSETESICNVSNCLSNVCCLSNNIWPCCINFLREHGTDARMGEEKKRFSLSLVANGFYLTIISLSE